MLVTMICDWAVEHKGECLNLLVTSNNHAAIRFYEKLGFVMTGRTEPYPNDPKLIENEMVLNLRK